MELRQLEYFVAVARHRHFGRAADAVYVSQPALSQQVRRLEAELGLALLRRTSRGVELTPAGAELLERAESILADAANARAAMDEHAGVVRGTVRVAATPADSPGLPEAIAGFHRDHPGVRIALRHASAAEALELTRSGAVDLAVLSLAGDATGLTVAPISDEPLRLITAPDDPPAGTVALADLKGSSFVLAEPGSALRATVMAACQEQGFSPVPLLEVGDPATVRHLVGAGLGVALVPASWLDVPGPDVGVAGVEPAPRHRVCMVTAGELPPAGRVLADRLR
ncbi:MAG TPA: LysR family transcriptional regulator [Solirubrobacteraceae bacterium]|nr:LysR family transcriptional regulator [Solirubrobacteraceae bacterium]